MLCGGLLRTPGAAYILDAMRTVVPSFLVLAACGGKIYADDAAGAASTAPSPDDVPSSAMLIDPGEPSPSPTAPTCATCTTDAECGPGAGCVAVTPGAGFCSPGCTKEGFCTPDRVCRFVEDPAGESWYACVPRSAGCEPRPRAARVHAGTW
jgi:hypothetical protein